MSIHQPSEVAIVSSSASLPAASSLSATTFRLLFQNSSDAIVITDENGAFLDVNAAACSLFGYTHQQMLLMRVSDLLTPSAPTAAEQYSHYLETGQESGEFSFVGPDGQVRIASYAAFRLEAGKHASILRDITAQKQVEEALRKEKEEFHAFFTASGEIVYKMSGDWKEMRALQGREFLASTNGPRLDWLTDYIPNEDQPQVRAAIEHAIATKTPFALEHRVIRQDGTIGWTFSRALPLLDNNGDIREWLGAAADVTARKEAEQALQDRIAEIETLLETIPAAVWIATDPECKRITGNRASYELLRMRPQSNVSKSAPPEEFPTTYRAFNNGREIEPHEHPMQRAAAERREILGAEETLLFADGTERDIYGNALPLFDAEGKVRGVIAAFVDITEQKRMERELRANQEWLTLAFNTARMVIWSWDFVADHIETTPNFLDVYGCPPVTMVEQGMAMVHPDDRARHEATVKEAIQTGRYFSVFRVVRPDNGAIVWVEEQGTVLADDMGKPHTMLGVAVDVTEREKLAQAKRESESQFRRLFEANVLGILITDLSGTVRQANDAFLNLIGYSREELEAGQISWVSLTPPELFYLDEEGVRQLRTSGVMTPCEKAYLHKDGHRVPVLVGAATLDSDPEVAIAYVLDLTGQKAHEQEIEELNDRLRRSMKETHHRVKNNLQVISAMIEMQVLEHKGAGTVPLEEFQRLKAHVHTLSIVHDLLTQSLKEQEDHQRISTKTVLEKLLPMLQQMAWRQTVRYSIDEVELTSKQCIALSLILNELVSNALKHGKKEADVFFTVEGQTVTLAVYDDGEGFPEGFNPKIAANTGLELVGSLVRTDLNGTISYSNQPAGGGQVVVTFPLPNDDE